MLKGKGFLRLRIGNGWTIGYDLKNRALVQITHDSSKPGYLGISGWFFHIVKAGYGEKYRLWIDLGWGHGLRFFRQR